MKTKMLVSLIALLGLLGSISLAVAQSTAFTYQGQLTDGGQAANGTYDLRFALYDDAEKGAAVGAPLTNAAVAVSDGLFTVALDFGDVFKDAAFWLEIGVRTNGESGFTALAPRQPLTATPYALYTKRAGQAAYADSVAAKGVTGTLSLAQLPGAVVTNGASALNLSGTFSGSGSGLTNVVLVNSNGLVGLGTNATQAGLQLASGPVAYQPNVQSRTFYPHESYTNLYTPMSVAVSSNHVLAVSSPLYNAITLMRIGSPSSPTLAAQFRDGDGGFTNLGSAWGVAFSGSVLAVASPGDNAVTLLSVSNPASPTKLAELRDGVAGFNLLSAPYHVAFAANGMLAIAAWGDDAVTLVNMTNPSSPSLAGYMQHGFGGFTNLWNPSQIAFSGTLLAIASPASNAVTLVDVSDPAIPRLRAVLKDGVNGFNDLAGADGLAFSTNNLLAIAAPDDDAVTLVDVSDPINPQRRSVLKDGIGDVRYLDHAGRVAFSGNLLVIAAAWDESLTLVDVSQPAAPVVRGQFVPSTPELDHLSYPSSLAFDGSTLVVSDMESHSITLLRPTPVPVNLLVHGMLGIGTALPQAPLHVTGNVIVSDARLVHLDTSRLELGIGSSATAGYSTAMGHGTTAEGSASTAMGAGTTASGSYSTAMGYGAQASGYVSTAMGEETQATGPRSTAMGLGSVASGDYSTAMGYRTHATGDNSTATGYRTTAGGYGAFSAGVDTEASGHRSFAAGNRAMATNTGCFVWADSQNTNFTSTGEDQFLIRAAGGVGIGTMHPSAALDVRGGACFGSAVAPLATGANNILNLMVGISTDASRNGITFSEDASATTAMKLGYNGAGTGAANRLAIYASDNGELFTFENGGNLGIGVANPAYPIHLASGAHVTAGGVWTDSSDRDAKENFQRVDAGQVLARVERLPITSWNYKAEDPSVRHIGPVAQDFHAAFGVGADDKHLAALDGNGVALAAIQGLNRKVESGKQKAETQIQELKAENTELKRRLDNLERLLAQRGGRAQ